MTRQTTITEAFTVTGPGLHTGGTAAVTLHPAEAGFGWRAVGRAGGDPTPLDWTCWVPSLMSTSVDLGGGTTIRTIEHMMAALVAHGVDNVLVEIQGTEVPIFDGSAARWCAALHEVGLTRLEAPRRAIRIRRPVQVARYGGFLRAEPASGFAMDLTYDLLPAFPVMAWRGRIDAACFNRELARARSFGNLHRRLGLATGPVPRPVADRPVAPNVVDPELGDGAAIWAAIETRQARLDSRAPLLKGWRPWRAALVVGKRFLPWPRWPDEPVRHVALDMIGDLALAGAPLIGRIVAHNPSHEKTYAMVATLMADEGAWEWCEPEAELAIPEAPAVSHEGHASSPRSRHRA